MEIYKQCPIALDGLQCTRDGKFLYDGKEKKVIYAFQVNGRKATARVTILKNGKCHYWQAAKLVASTWLRGFQSDSYITYKDGNCHNICADNLLLTDHKAFYEYMRRNSVFKGNGDIEQRKKKLRIVIEEASLTLEYFKTKQMDGINKHVKEYLYPCLMKYCLETLHMGVKTALEQVPEALAVMYDCIMNAMCLYNYERYCKKLLHNYKTKGNFGVTGYIPKPIKIEVESLNLDCLWERYKVTRLK